MLITAKVVKVVKVVEPSEISGGRVFSVTIGETEYTAKVLRSFPLSSSCFYRITLHAPDGSKVRATDHPQWRTIRKQLLREMLKHEVLTGMSPRIARV